MSEYIERERLLEVLERNFGYTHGGSVMKQLIETQPAADVAPVRHGKWIFNDDWWEFICTNCHKGIGNIKKYPFCPNCGARMDEEE